MWKISWLLLSTRKLFVWPCFKLVCHWCLCNALCHCLWSKEVRKIFVITIKEIHECQFSDWNSNICLLMVFPLKWTFINSASDIIISYWYENVAQPLNIFHFTTFSASLIFNIHLIIDKEREMHAWFPHSFKVQCTVTILRGDFTRLWKTRHFCSKVTKCERILVLSALLIMFMSYFAWK